MVGAGGGVVVGGGDGGGGGGGVREGDSGDEADDVDRSSVVRDMFARVIAFSVVWRAGASADTSISCCQPNARSAYET